MTTPPSASEVPLTRGKRLRRVVIVCASFGRNLAYYRVGQEKGRAVHPEDQRHASFWRQVNGNFLDLCVLEWCQLFGERERRRDDYGGANMDGVRSSLILPPSKLACLHNSI